MKATYSYVATDVTPVATATDVLTLTGKTGILTRITRITAMGTATGAAVPAGASLYLSIEWTEE